MLVTRRRRRVAALTVAGALGVAACGGTGDDPSGAEPAVTEATVGPDGAPDSPATTIETTIQAGNDETADEPASTTPAVSGPVVTGGTETAPADDVGTTTEAPEILRFSAPTVGGGELDLAAIGDRPVLLWFWAPF